ncbi:hypothetical protein BV25DRAFT_1829975 [Artomyces pyxidatus]|uniref:Uncharacterized protein n=1 Tax=Artomyces pyxidatus TaxID=48021 RepID=A0ACB8SQQ5_9AGAM|nr:hypothetical protein BV25DRAFT_1829975 [Artomyces pyxidatus]
MEDPCWDLHTLDVDKKSDHATFLFMRPFCTLRPQYLNELALTTEEPEAVMLSWEKPRIIESVRVLLEGREKRLSVLNIGFGMGYAFDQSRRRFPQLTTLQTDFFFQDHKPTAHTIIEAHPDVLSYMHSSGFSSRPGVTVIEGKWQDALKDGADIGRFDAIYFETFEESYRDHLEFFVRVPSLLRDHHSRFSFFNIHGRHHDSI